jgi:RNA polymerase sigma factor (sigma-70 family)
MNLLTADRHSRSRANGANSRRRVEQERQLISRVLKRDIGADVDLINGYRPLIYFLLKRSGIRPQDQADVFQEIWLKLWRHDLRALRQWQKNPDASFSAYLTVIARNVAFDHGRKTLEMLPISDSTSEEALPENSIHFPNTIATSRTPAGFDDYLLRRERRTYLLGCIARLCDRDADLIRRRYFDGESYQEIASAWVCSEDNVGVALMRARRRLRKLLEANREVHDSYFS